jgi:hypothetical protein
MLFHMSAGSNLPDDAAPLSLKPMSIPINTDDDMSIKPFPCNADKANR